MNSDLAVNWTYSKTSRPFLKRKQIIQVLKLCESQYQVAILTAMVLARLKTLLLDPKEWQFFCKYIERRNEIFHTLPALGDSILLPRIPSVPAGEPRRLYRGRNDADLFGPGKLMS